MPRGYSGYRGYSLASDSGGSTNNDSPLEEDKIVVGDGGDNLKTLSNFESNSSFISFNSDSGPSANKAFTISQNEASNGSTSDLYVSDITPPNFTPQSLTNSSLCVVNTTGSSELWSWDNENSMWDIISTKVIPLDVINYGDFNSVLWNSLSTGTYILNGTGSQFLNYSTDYILNPVAVYNFLVEHINDSLDFRQETSFVSSGDFSNSSINQKTSRGGVDFSSAVNTGWDKYAFFSDIRNLGSISTFFEATGLSRVVPPGNTVDILDEFGSDFSASGEQIQIPNGSSIVDVNGSPFTGFLDDANGRIIFPDIDMTTNGLISSSGISMRWVITGTFTGISDATLLIEYYDLDGTLNIQNEFGSLSYDREFQLPYNKRQQTISSRISKSNSDLVQNGAKFILNNDISNSETFTITEMSFLAFISNM